MIKIINNNYIPKVGDIVKLIGHCHPKFEGRLGKVIESFDGWHTLKIKDCHSNTFVLSSGENGGLKLVFRKGN